MGRWDNLKCEKGEEREWHNKHSQFNREKRWASSNTNNTLYGSLEQNFNRSSLNGSQQHRRQRKLDSNEIVSSSENDPVHDENLLILKRGLDTHVDALKSELFRYQAGRGNTNDREHGNTVEVENLFNLLCNSTNTNRPSRTSEQPENTRVFLAIVDLLKVTEENFDGDDNMRFLLVRTIESYLKLSVKDLSSISKVKLTKDQVEYVINILSSHFNDTSFRPIKARSIGSSLLVTIALMVRHHVHELPPEWTARRVVGAIFIPYFPSMSKELNQLQGKDRVYQYKSSTSTSPIFTLNCVCKTLSALLQNPSHASAILAPLVEDISIQSEYGFEEQTMNPLRMELLKVLLKCLEPGTQRQATKDAGTISDDENHKTRIMEQLCVCRTLSIYVDAIRKLKNFDGSTSATYNDEDVEIIKPLQKFVLRVVTKYNKIRGKHLDAVAYSQDLIVASLQLLRALIACYPNDVTGLGWKLIIEGANRNMDAALCHSISSCKTNSSVNSSYLPLMLMATSGYEIEMQRRKNDSKYQALTMECLADFILVLPWKKWLKQNGASHENHSGYNTTIAQVMTGNRAVTSGMYKNVVDALTMLITISKNFFSKCRDPSLMISLGHLVKTLLLDIPYCDIKLMRSGQALWELIAMSTLKSLKSSKISLEKEKENLAYDLLVTSSGGSVTPRGNLRGMSLPAQIWFLSKDASVDFFLKELIDLFESLDGPSDRVVKILSSILRTLPEIALRRWGAFQKIFPELHTGNTKNSSKNSKVLMQIEVFEAFMLGRKDFDVSIDLRDKNDVLITDLDGILLKQWSQRGLHRCINIYSSFRSEDWMHLDQIDDRVICHFEKIISFCHNSSAKIREGAARAVGEFCTQYLSRSCLPGDTLEVVEIQQCQLLTRKVHATMREICRDQNAGARAMSIFALGNLASALKESNSKQILDTPRLHEMSKSILCSFKDNDEKVVKNAIRSAGHTSILLALSMRQDNDEHFSTSSMLLVEVIDSLTQKLWNTLDAAMNTKQKASMTWKERSAAKKHGWGACFSLGLVFEGLQAQIFEEREELVSACSEAVRCLSLCQSHYTNLNEKIVLAAMAAICHLPNQFLTLSDSKKNCLGDALKTSILILEFNGGARIDTYSSNTSKKKAITAKLLVENEKFLRHLLNSASFADAADVLNDDRIGTKTLGVLYMWMVERRQIESLQARAFEIFAVSLQHASRWSASVGLEQQFTSRALQKYKQEQNGQDLLPRENESEPLQNNTEYEVEADEL